MSVYGVQQSQPPEIGGCYACVPCGALVDMGVRLHPAKRQHVYAGHGIEHLLLAKPLGAKPGTDT